MYILTGFLILNLHWTGFKKDKPPCSRFRMKEGDWFFCSFWFSLGIAQYLAPFTLLSTLTTHSVPADFKNLHRKMLVIPCFTVGGLPEAFFNQVTGSTIL